MLTQVMLPSIALAFCAMATAAVAQPSAAQSIASDLPGVWSVGDTANCTDGPAWVFFADGFYGEMKLPSSAINAVGIWRDTGEAILFTHMHLPFAGLETPVAPKPLKIVTRTADRIDALSVRGTRRVFHRCPVSALKAPPSDAAH